MTKLSIHNFDSIEDAPFDVYEYSRMKFGSDRVAKNFGYEMADVFFTQFDVNRPTVVIPAPSTTVAVASTLISHHFMKRLNSILSHSGGMPVEWTMIHRNMTYNNNYADLPKEDRKKLLAADSIYINKDFIQGKQLIFIDDCTITGTHEEKIEDFLDENGIVNQRFFVSYAKYIGDDPSIEMRLNHTEIRDASDLVNLSWEQDHKVTTRSLRLLLEYPDQYFDDLLDAASERFIEDSYHAAIVKGYDKHPPYRTNFYSLATRLGIIEDIKEFA